MSLTDDMEPIRQLVEDITKVLVDQPRGVEVQQVISQGGGTAVLTIKTLNGDTGKVIGKEGRNAHAIRTLLDSFAAKLKCQIVLEIDDPRRRKRERSRHNGKAKRAG